jgi:hypothetical protein
MKNGICPRCGTNEIQKVNYTNGHRDNLSVSTWSSVKLNEYVCCSCGLVETYIAAMEDVEKIKDKCTKVETKE